MELNNFNDPRPTFIGSNRLGTEHKSKARIDKEIRGATNEREEVIDKLAAQSDGYTRESLSERRARKNKTENRVRMGLTAAVAAGAVAVAMSSGGKNSNENHRDAIKQQTIENKASAAYAQDRQEAQAMPAPIDQADIERFQEQQTELHRPAEK